MFLASKKEKFENAFNLIFHFYEKKKKEEEEELKLNKNIFTTSFIRKYDFRYLFS